MSSMESMSLSFSGHQTFPFRYAWLPKGVALASKDPAAFVSDRGMVELGVGKNMVSAIRHWLETLGLMRLDGRSGRGEVLGLGKALFGSNGYDPYLEDPATLWLLQWQLVKNPVRASCWYLTFTRWNRPVLSREELTDWLLAIVLERGVKKVSRASLRRDVDVFLRTYVPAAWATRRLPEDSFDCPLAELGLLEQIDGDLFTMQRGIRETLPMGILAFAVDDYWQRSAREQETLSFERILYGPGSPGGAFQLSESAMTELLEAVPRWTGLSYDESAGMRRLVRASSSKSRLPLESYLDRVYSRAGV